MGKLGKIVGIFVVVVILVVVGLAVFVRFYLTDERIKAIVIPQAEKNLGRTVAIGDISVGLLSGISIADFIVKETDGKDDFINVKSFVISYDLLPLLQKKLIISEISLQEPTIRVQRDRAGKFNFESLTILEKGEEKPVKDEPTAVAALPVALTIEKVSLEKARLVVRDELNELPTLETLANAKVSVDLAQDISSLRYEGSMDFVADATYGGMKPHVEGKGNFNQNQVEFDIDSQLDTERAKLAGNIKNYTKSPHITLNISSQALNIDHLLDLTAGLPPKTREDASRGKTEDAGKKTPPAAGIPPGLVAQGQIRIDQALYKGIKIHAFLVRYALDKGILSIDDLSAKTLGGALNSNMQVDLNRPDLAYSGKLGVKSLQMTAIGSDLVKQLSDTVSGTLESALTFSGAGTKWENIKKTLTTDGSFTLANGRISGTPVSRSIANLVGLPELNNLSFQDMAGTFQMIKGGKITLNTKLDSKDIKADADGTVSLDGALDLPLILRLSKDLGDKLKSRASVAKYLADQQGETVLRLKLAGTAGNPRPALDAAGVQETIKQKAIEKLGDVLSGKKTGDTAPAGQEGKETKGEEVQELIKGLFGR